MLAAWLAPLLAAEPAHGLDRLIEDFANRFPIGTFYSFSFNVRAQLALLLVSLTCGAVGALIVGGRMAFFSDALAHCAFAGVSVGFLLFEWLLASRRPAGEFWEWVTPVMLAFGILVGLGIAAVRQGTGLASDTVIGVFFAAAIGLAAMLRKLIESRQLFSLEEFLFGDPLLIGGSDLVHLAVFTLITAVVLGLIYNHLLLTSFNPSLALSRRVRVRAVNYAFIVLLAILVNLCLRTVGVLLINALLVVPAATAVNVSRNLRQVFWLTVGLCVGASLLGQLVSWEVGTATNDRIKLGVSGTVILLSVGLFFASLLLEPWRQWQRRRHQAPPAPAG
jgi:zinc transport system permease protein